VARWGLDVSVTQNNDRASPLTHCTLRVNAYPIYLIITYRKWCTKELPPLTPSRGPGRRCGTTLVLTSCFFLKRLFLIVYENETVSSQTGRSVQQRIRSLLG
jgi:hypothetical protein